MNQVLILFVFLGVLLGLAWSFMPKAPTADATAAKFTNEQAIIHPQATKMATLDERILGVGQAWDDTMWSPLSNRKDPNSLYNLWYSNMIKQGMSKDYITPKIFESLYALSERNEWTKENVGKVIAASYHLEKERYADLQKARAARKLTTPLCTQY